TNSICARRVVVVLLPVAFSCSSSCSLSFRFIGVLIWCESFVTSCDLLPPNDKAHRQPGTAAPPETQPPKAPETAEPEAGPLFGEAPSLTGSLDIFYSCSGPQSKSVFSFKSSKK